MARGGSNSARTQTREGIDVETVHRVLAGTDGWSVHVGVPVAELNAPVSRSLRLLFSGTAASVGLAIALGLVIAREIAQRRRMESLQSAAALLDSEKRGALAVDAAELGTWRWDLSANEFTGCNRFCALLGLAGCAIGGNPIAGRATFFRSRTAAPRRADFVRAMTAWRAANPAASNFRFSPMTAENTGCARRGGRRGRPTGVM